MAMAEVFKNFNANLTQVNSDLEIVPSGLLENTSNNSINSRTVGSVIQVHSLYVTNVWTPRIINENRYKEEYFKHFDLFIIDKNDNSKIYIAHDVELVPGCPFYIEKNITLTPSQTLNIFAPTAGDSTQGNSSVNIHIVASAIEFLSDE